MHLHREPFQTVKKVRNRHNRFTFLWIFSPCVLIQKAEYLEFYNAKNAYFSRILTYCATHALPYLCTPTGVSCLPSELFSSLSACRKGFFDTLQRLPMHLHREPFGLFDWRVYQYMPPMPPAPAAAAAAAASPAGSGLSATSDSVVRTQAPIDAAFSNAVRVTLVGSTMPVGIMSQ